MPGPGTDCVRLMLGGDAMLGRTVREYIGRLGATYPLGMVAPLLRQADLAIVNLECAITRGTRHWPGAPKAFYFGAPPEAIYGLADAGIDLVSLANNHTLDYDVQGLCETLRALDVHGIGHAGAGASRARAWRPAIVERAGLRFGMAAFCDHQQDFAAAAQHPGIAFLDLADEAAALAAFAAALAPLQRQRVHWPILSLHWGPNRVWRPSARFRRLAHGAIEMGWKILFGHSAHVFHGIELWQGRPILYATGDLVDDYYVDPAFRNDEQLLFELEVDRDALRSIRLYPIGISKCRAAPADAAQQHHIFTRMRQLCRDLGTRVREDGAVLVIEPAGTCSNPVPCRAPSSG